MNFFLNENEEEESSSEEESSLPPDVWRVATAEEWTIHQQQHGIECYLGITTKTTHLRLELALAEVYSGSYFCDWNHIRAVEVTKTKNDGTKWMMDRTKSFL